jgi:gliding motility-associated-like protein
MQIQNITIANETVLLQYTNTGTPVTCNNNGTITVNVYSGAAVAYEIISGPMIRPLQPSNLFTGLAAGVYEIRVFDTCGEGWVTTHTLLAVNGNFMSWTESIESETRDCIGTTITNSFDPELNPTLSFPVTIIYTINPSTASPIVTTTTVTSGDISAEQFVTYIPYTSDEVYNYTVTVTDACGNGYYFEKTLISIPYLVEFRAPPAECGEYYITFAQDNFVAPVTVTFLDAPAGFDPEAYSLAHPGPFYDALINYGSNTNGVPFGHYEALLTDACGHSTIVEATLQYIVAAPTVETAANPGCDGNRSTVNIRLTGYTFISIIIDSGPASYSSDYPIDLSSLIEDGEIEIPNMNTGNYSVTITDDCGNIYTVPFFVPDLQTQLLYIIRPACELEHGGVRITAPTTVTLLSVIMTSAPATYAQTMPYDVSFNINMPFTDTFSMTSLPEGDYTFDIVDSCGLSNTLTIFIDGLEVLEDNYTLIPHCGSFDLDFNYTFNGTNGRFWLQKLDHLTGNWVHPQNGIIYVPGAVPNDANGYPITSINPSINYNISYLGDFRIINRFETWENGSVGLYKVCINIVHEFTFFNEIEITNIQKTTCNGFNSNVFITAIGVPPLTYEIISKNGQPFNINNGNNSVFTNLEPAVYNFQIGDSCGNFTNQLTDVALLPSLVVINSTVPDMIACDGTDGDSKATFDLTTRNALVLDPSALPSNFTITYHESLSDATTNLNVITNPQGYVSTTATIFCRVEYLNSNTCFEITQFELIVNEFPVLQMQLTHVLCAGEAVTINADAGFDSYLWSTGETTPTIIVEEAGTYTLEVTQTTNGITCTATYTIEVLPSLPATIDHIETTDWTPDQNTIAVILSQGGNYVFSLDNINYQTSPTFYGLLPGNYTVYIRHANGCEPVRQEVHLLAYPKFFTPNDDSYNDYWQIINAPAEPNMKVSIFDRYGKLLTGFGSDSLGWDGYYNGRQMPSTDYWFLVIRENGMEHRGHFAMKR